MAKPKSSNGSADHFPRDDDAEVRVTNWKRIRELERQLSILDSKSTDKEKIIFEFFDLAARNDSKCPFIVPIHLDDLKKLVKRGKFTKAMIRKTMEKMNLLDVTKKVHPSNGNYLINVTKKGLGKLRNDIQVLNNIKNCYPKGDEDEVALESRLKERNKVLKKFELFRLASV